MSVYGDGTLAERILNHCKSEQGDKSDKAIRKALILVMDYFNDTAYDDHDKVE